LLKIRARPHPIESPLLSEKHQIRGTEAMLIHRTRQSHLRMAAAMDHIISGTPKLRISSETTPDLARVVATDVLEPGQRLRLVKFVSYGWSHDRSLPAMRDQVAAIEAARAAGWDTRRAGQRGYLDKFWQNADVELDGAPELQQGVRFSLFHIISSSARAESRAIPAKGLTGTGYDGHSFWDTELYILPVLTYTAPSVAADALRWRHSILNTAKARARDLDLAGAAFPWRTIHGEECSGYWPAGTAAFHINADIASAVLHYFQATGDDSFARNIGIDILVETARLWRSLGHFDLDGDFRIDGVTGPDEYSATADNNIYTNMMARRNLRGGAAACEHYPERANDLGVTADEIESWRNAADHVVIPYDDKLGVHQQSEGFTHHELWDFEATKETQYPLMLHFPYVELYRKQVVKQPDLILAMHVCYDSFTPEQRARNFDYYERITVRHSSLSAGTEAVAAADAGYLRLAFDYAAEAALLDLEDDEHNTRDGLHLASLAGAWIAFAFGLGGMRGSGDILEFTPRLPDGLTRLKFSLPIEAGASASK
jgi:alpha,alpha-trehalose phosphorylase